MKMRRGSVGGMGISMGVKNQDQDQGLFQRKEGCAEDDCDEEGDDEDNHDKVEAQMPFMFCCRKCKSTRVDFPSGITASNRMNDKRKKKVYSFICFYKLERHNLTK